MQMATCGYNWTTIVAWYYENFSRPRKKWFLVVVIAATILTFGLYKSISPEPYYESYEYHPNYFTNKVNRSYIVSTPKCKIPSLDAWDPDLLDYFRPRRRPPVCFDISRRWTYLDESLQAVILNFTAMLEDGYVRDSVACCYQEILRLEADSLEYNRLSDSTVRLSTSCVPLPSEQNLLTVEFIKVKCSSKYWPFFKDVVYQDYHALVQPLKSSVTKEKVRSWEDVKEIPPSVVILGMDSISRLNFQRTMTKTRTLLQSLGAVEMLGYTKVGENTFPNAVVFLSGYSEEVLHDICYSRYAPQDSCPYLWKRFNSSKYLTAHLEDEPKLGIFNYEKRGFLKQQVDFYLRPFMLSAYPPLKFDIDCIGPDTVDRKVLRYVGGLLKGANRHHTPLFALTWLTNLAHGDRTAPIFADDTYAKYIGDLDLGNTILFFISDHGSRYGSFRETELGWYEDKLPNFWVYLPPTIRQEHPEWMANLHLNSKRLTSPYDLYHTLNHILNEFTNSTFPEDSRSKDGSALRRKYGQSFFNEIPLHRDCEDAGVGEEFCACSIPKRIPVDDVNLTKAVKAVIDFMNGEILPPQCAKLRLREVTAGASTFSAETSSSSWNYICAFTADPGGFLLEATVRYDKVQGNFSVVKDVLRMNRITRQTSCVHGGILERLCYCL